MKWKQINANCLESGDGKWAIAKYKGPDGWMYQLIRLGKRKGAEPRVSYEGSESVHIARTADECKAVARGKADQAAD